MAIKLIFPSENNRIDVLDFYKEIIESNSECIGLKYYNDYDLWLTEMRNRKLNINLPNGFVRENFYLCYDDTKLIGVYSFKFELTDYLLNFGGHIGYAIRPSERRKGYATQILKEGLLLAKNFGFDKVLCVCNEDNIASEKTIIKNGGVFDNILFDSEENINVKRFWITL